MAAQLIGRNFFFLRELSRSYLSGSQMQLVFPSEKLMELLSGIGAKIASLQPLTASLEKYKSIAIGFNFSK